MLELALYYGKGPLMMQAIADKQGVSRKYLDAIFASLKSAGLVRSRRGAGGGHMLGKDPEEITLDEVFRALDGPTALVDCVADSEICQRSHRCVTRGVWSKVGDAIDGALSAISLADLVREHKEIEEGRCEHPRRAYIDDDDPEDLDAAAAAMTASS